jgi:hypothetical protein
LRRPTCDARFGGRQIRADQVLVDFRKQRGVGVEPIENGSGNPLMPELAHCFKAVPPGNEPITSTLSRA